MRKKFISLCLALALLVPAWTALLPSWTARGEAAPPEASEASSSASSAEEVSPTEAPPVQETLPPQETPAPEPAPAPSPEAPPQEEGGEGEEPVSPEESASPEASSSPEASPSPEGSPSPEASPSPEGSPSPGASPSPSASPSPEPEEPIRVMVPESGQVIVNPYGMSVQVDGVNRKEQVIHQAQSISNLGEVPVQMNVRVFGQTPEGSRVRFVTAPPAQGSAGQEAFVYAEFAAQPDSWAGTYTGAGNQVVVTEEGNERAGILQLAPGSEGYFRLFGSLSAPNESMWTENDVLRVRLIFNFARLPEEHS